MVLNERSPRGRGERFITIKNFRVGGLVVVVVDSVAVNIRKCLNSFTPFESSKLGGNYIAI